MEQVTREYLSEMNQYRKEISYRIAAKEARVTAYKAQVANAITDVKATCEKQLAVGWYRLVH